MERGCQQNSSLAAERGLAVFEHEPGRKRHLRGTGQTARKALVADRTVFLHAGPGGRNGGEGAAGADTGCESAGQCATVATFCRLAAVEPYRRAPSREEVEEVEEEEEEKEAGEAIGGGRGGR